MQITDKELSYIGDQLKAEALAIAKCTSYAQQSNDPRLQQLYARAAERHRSHYETLLRYVQGATPPRQF